MTRYERSFLRVAVTVNEIDAPAAIAAMGSVPRVRTGETDEGGVDYDEPIRRLDAFRPRKSGEPAY
jgi:hypothetical protein